MFIQKLKYLFITLIICGTLMASEGASAPKVLEIAGEEIAYVRLASPVELMSVKESKYNAPSSCQELSYEICVARNNLNYSRYISLIRGLSKHMEEIGLTKEELEKYTRERWQRKIKENNEDSIKLTHLLYFKNYTLPVFSTVYKDGKGVIYYSSFETKNTEGKFFKTYDLSVRHKIFTAIRRQEINFDTLK